MKSFAIWNRVTEVKINKKGAIFPFASKSRGARGYQ
jgi:hypothetical protein